MPDLLKSCEIHEALDFSLTVGWGGEGKQARTQNMAAQCDKCGKY